MVGSSDGPESDLLVSRPLAQSPPCAAVFTSLRGGKWASARSHLGVDEPPRPLPGGRAPPAWLPSLLRALPGRAALRLCVRSVPGATCNTRPRPGTRGPAPGRAALRPCVPPAPPEAPPRDATPRPISARFQDGGCSACPAVRVAVTTGSRGPGMWSKGGGGERPGQKLRATGRRSLGQRLQTRWNKEPVQVGVWTEAGGLPEQGRARAGGGWGAVGAPQACGWNRPQNAGHTPPGEPARCPAQVPPSPLPRLT